MQSRSVHVHVDVALVCLSLLAVAYVCEGHVVDRPASHVLVKGITQRLAVVKYLTQGEKAGMNGVLFVVQQAKSTDHASAAATVEVSLDQKREFDQAVAALHPSKEYVLKTHKAGSDPHLEKLAAEKKNYQILNALMPQYTVKMHLAFESHCISSPQTVDKAQTCLNLIFEKGGVAVSGVSDSVARAWPGTKKLTILKNALKALHKLIYDAGYAIDDLNSGNLLLDPLDQVHFIDLETVQKKDPQHRDAAAHIALSTLRINGHLCDKLGAGKPVIKLKKPNFAMLKLIETQSQSRLRNKEEACVKKICDAFENSADAKTTVETVAKKSDQEIFDHFGCH